MIWRKGSSSKSAAEARRLRRQRNLDRTEIPPDHVLVTDELLGKGGFGAVYLADYNGRNAAAKVRHTHDLSFPSARPCGTALNASLKSSLVCERLLRGYTPCRYRTIP